MLFYSSALRIVSLNLKYSVIRNHVNHQSIKLNGISMRSISGYAVRNIRNVLKWKSQKHMSDTIIVPENPFWYSLNSFDTIIVIIFSATTKNKII